MSRKSSRAPRRNTGVIIVLILLMMVFIAGTALMIKLSLDLPNRTPDARPGQSDISLPSSLEEEPLPTETEAPPETTMPEPEHVVSTATIVSTGDILMHKPLIDVNWRDNAYNFESIFRYIAEDVTAADCDKLVIAYEPVWAIGTGKTATPDQAQEVHALIRETLAKLVGAETAETVRIQYGGSMKPGNAAELLAKKDIDGGLIGGAALKAADFAGIIAAAAQQ